MGTPRVLCCLSAVALLAACGTPTTAPLDSSTDASRLESIAETNNSTIDGPTVELTPAVEVTPLDPAPGWVQLGQSPLSPRTEAVGVWTGSEVLVLGGTETPMCPGCDYAEAPPYLRDGAAYASATDTWRPIADLPPEAAGYSSAIAIGDDDVFLLSQTSGQIAVWQYSISRDAWTNVPSLQRAPSSARIGGHNGHLVLYAGSDEQGEVPDQVLDPETGVWSDVPNDPFEASYDRQLLSVDGALILFAKPISAAIDSSQVPRVLAARFDEATGTWQILPDGDQLSPPTFADGTVAVSPYRGGADGGEVNNWGRLVPNGGMLDLSTQTWSHLPGETKKDQWGGGVVGRSGASFTGVQGDVLDLVSGEWFTIPDLPSGLSDGYAHTVVAAGTDLFVFGGGLQGTVSNDASMWHTNRVPPAPKT